MKIPSILAAAIGYGASSTSAFVVVSPARSPAPAAARLNMIGRESNVDLTGNSWKPDSEKMGSTDTGDYFPEGYDRNAIAFTEGMGGSSAPTRGDRGPALPGMENLGADAVMSAGIDMASEIPPGMAFVMSSVPDATIDMDVASNSSKGAEVTLSVKPVCMGYEDYYAAFTSDSHPSFSVSPVAGRMDRRGGEPTELVVRCNAQGRAGTFVGNLVINLPEDNSKICYKITAKSY